METAGITLPGVLPQRRLAVTQDVIDAYAEVSGDRNPLHLDPAFARTTRYGRTVAHGFMSLALLSATVEEWLGGAWPEGSTLEAKFVAPVFAAENVVTEGRVVEHEALSSPTRTLIRCELRCLAYGRETPGAHETPAGRVVIAAEAAIILRSAVNLTPPDGTAPPAGNEEKGRAE